MPAEDMIKFCEYFNLGMTFDICHAGLYCNHSNVDLAAYAEKVKHIVSHMHISDAKGIDGEGVQIGAGNIKFHEVFGALKDKKYTWVTEIWSGHLHNGAGTYKSLHHLEKFKGLL